MSSCDIDWFLDPDVAEWASIACRIGVELGELECRERLLAMFGAMPEALAQIAAYLAVAAGAAVQGMPRVRELEGMLADSTARIFELGGGA